MTPFELDIGMKPRLPVDIATKLIDNRNKSLTEFMNNWEENWALAHKHIFNAQSKQKQSFDKHHREETYQIGDRAWLRKDRSALNDGITQVSKLGPRVEGPYEITELHGDYNVSLKLDKGDKRHNRFHVSQLRPYVERDIARFPMIDNTNEDNKDEGYDVDTENNNTYSSINEPSDDGLPEQFVVDESRPTRNRKAIDRGFFMKH